MFKGYFKATKAMAVVVAAVMLVITIPAASAAPIQVQAAVDASTRAEIESALYNAEYYEKANDDVAVALNYDDEKMYEHWLNYGKAEGRNASMVFNAKYYLEKNPEVAAIVGNDYVAAYEHFINEGLQAGLESSPVFSVQYYLQANTDVAQVFNGDYISAAKHFNLNAIAEGRSGSGNFDYTVYRACNTDVEDLYGEYIEGYYIHYINHGRAEGRTGGLAAGNNGDSGNGGTTGGGTTGGGSTGGSTGSTTEIDRTETSYRIFDAEFYLERYPMLASSVGTDADSLYLYWIEEGIAQGQTASPVIVPEEYLERNADVADVFGNDYGAAIRHFLNNGIYEGRSASYEFDYTVYQDCNTDVAEVFGDDVVGYYFHYVNYGIDENRTARLTVSVPEEAQVFEWTENTDGTLTLKKFNSTTETNVVVPAEVDGKAVTAIGYGAFSGKNNLLSIEIPDSVVKIANNAFANSENLESVIVRGLTMELGASVFANCADFTVTAPENTDFALEAEQRGFTVIKTEGIAIPETAEDQFRYETLPDGTICITGYMTAAGSVISVPDTIEGKKVTQIGSCAFIHQKSLKHVILPESVTAIGEDAFNGSALKYLILPDAVTSIGSRAFSNTYLMGLEIPANVTEIGSGILAGAFSVEEVRVAEGNTAYTAKDGVLFSADLSVLVQMPNRFQATTYSVPETVTVIAVDAFRHSTLQEVALPEGLRYIGNSAFNNMLSLKTIAIPASVEYIGDGAFSGGFLTEFTIASGNQKYCTVDGMLLSKDKTICYGQVVTSGVTEVTIPEGVVEIAPDAFAGMINLCSVTMPSTLKRIGEYAFSNMACLGEIKWSSALEEIGEYAFYSCGVDEVVLPEGLKSIAPNAFYYNKALVSVTIPESMTSLNAYVFGSCPNLSKVEIPASVTAIDEYCFDRCESLVIYTTKGAYAETFAIQNEIQVVASAGVPQLGEFPEITEVNSTVTGIEVFTSEEAVNEYVCEMIWDNYSGFYVMAEELSMLHTAEEYMWMYPEFTLEIESLVKYKNGYLMRIENADLIYEIDAEHMYALRTGDTSMLDARELAAYNKLFSITEELGLDDMETDIEKIKAVHDYLVLNVTYDLEHLQYGTNPEAHYVEGTLLDGLAVCSGYASAFRLFMEIQDINCDYVMNADHAWNLVELDDKWYVMDVTWDDPTPDVPGRVVYNYFMVTEEIIANAGGHDNWFCECGQTHECDNEEYLLYPEREFVCTTAEEAQALIQSQAGGDTITLIYSADGELTESGLLNMVWDQIQTAFSYSSEENYRPGYHYLSVMPSVD